MPWRSQKPEPVDGVSLAEREEERLTHKIVGKKNNVPGQENLFELPRKSFLKRSQKIRTRKISVLQVHSSQQSMRSWVL